jgi:uncharacterized protein YqiB (DUF1249 family)
VVLSLHGTCGGDDDEQAGSRVEDGNPRGPAGAATPGGDPPRQHYGIGLVDLDATVLDPALARVIERDYAWRHRLVPIGRAGDRLTVAMDDPGDRWVIEDLGRTTGCRIEVVTATSAALRRAFTRLYRDRTVAENAGAVEAGHVETRRILAAVGATSQQIRLSPR